MLFRSKASKAGFRWADISGEVDKLEEEAAELAAAISSGGPAGVKEELGDVLFACCCIAQMQGVDPEKALQAACDKFNGRFRSVEESTLDKPLSQYSQEELLALWRAAKAKES